MFSLALPHFVLPLLFVTSQGAQGQPTPDYLKKVETVVGKSGKVNADGSLRINIPRSEVAFSNQNGMAISADLGLATYIAFSGNESRSLAIGDVAMLANEIDGVIDALQAGEIEIVSLHNHMATESPRLFFLHFQKSGNPLEIAETFRRALNVLGHGAKATPIKKAPKPKLDADALAAVFGGKPQVFPSGVLRFSSPRKDITQTLDGQAVLPGKGLERVSKVGVSPLQGSFNLRRQVPGLRPSLQHFRPVGPPERLLRWLLASWAGFSACECGQTMAMGDTCCLRGELQRAMRALRSAGIHITAIHNHLLGASSEVLFMHWEGESESVNLAKAVKSCWNELGK